MLRYDKGVNGRIVDSLHNSTSIKLKGDPKQRNVTGLIDRTGNKMTHSNIFYQFMVPIVQKFTFKGYKNIFVSTTILCLAVSVFGVVNNASKCGIRVYHIKSQPFFCSSLGKSSEHGCTLRNFISEQKNKNKSKRTAVA